MADIILRSSRPAGAGNGLTNAEIDGNFTNINDELEATTSSVAGKANADHSHATGDIDGLAAALGVFSDAIATLAQTVDEKQDALVSGENVKTVNGQSILGAGNITIDGSGAPGMSAYQLAVLEGFEGTLGEWLESLEGTPGTPGTNGTNGANGDPGPTGLSAYQLALQEGFVGTLPEWLASLKGEPGEDGTGGVSSPEDVRDALATLSGADRLDASAIKNLPTLTPGNPVEVTHDGTGENPVMGDTVTAVFADGWFGAVQWRRNGADIAGANSSAYTLVEADVGTTITPRISGLGYIASGFVVDDGGSEPPDPEEPEGALKFGTHMLLFGTHPLVF